MSSSVLELLEESSDELPRISDLEEEPNEVLSSDVKEMTSLDKNDRNEIVEISDDDEIIEISSEEQLPSFEKTQNNNRKAGFIIMFYITQSEEGFIAPSPMVHWTIKIESSKAQET